MDKKIRYLNILAFLGVILVNFLANALPINNQTTGEVSARYPVLFTPAGYVFSIWGLIYLLLLGFVIYQALPSQFNRTIIKTTGNFFILNFLLNISWILAWHYNLVGLSLIIMLGLLFTLIVLYMRVDNKKTSSFADKLFVKLPISIYLGWISVATIANVSVFLYNMNWNAFGFSPVFWTVAMIIVGAVLAIFNLITNKDIAFALVFVWAFIGIGVRHGNDIAFITIIAFLSSVAIVYTIWRTTNFRISNLKTIH